jgi:hypothetical protein
MMEGPGLAIPLDQPPGVREGYPSGTPLVFGVSRSPETLDVFTVRDGDGGIFTAHYPCEGNNEDISWSDWQQITSYAMAASHTTVCAVSRTPDTIDAFAVLVGGAIVHAAWRSGSQWMNWETIGSNPTALPGTSVCALSRSPETLDIFAVGPERNVITANWESSRGWSEWQAIGAFETNQTPHAVSRTPDTLDIFASRYESPGVWHASTRDGNWSVSTDWRRVGNLVVVSGDIYSGTGPMLTAVARTHQFSTIDLFAVGARKSSFDADPQDVDAHPEDYKIKVYTTSWRPGGSEHDWQSWYPVLGGEPPEA